MTGGSRGIGRAVVHGMASLGHRVIFTYNSSSKSTVQSVCDAYPDGMVTATCLDQGNKKEYIMIVFLSSRIFAYHVSIICMLSPTLLTCWKYCLMMDTLQETLAVFNNFR